MTNSAHISNQVDRHKAGNSLLFPYTNTFKKSYSFRQNNRNIYLLPEQEPASGTKQGSGEAKQSAIFINTDEWMVNTEKKGLAGPAELLTVQGRLIQEEQRSGRGKILPR